VAKINKLTTFHPIGVKLTSTEKLVNASQVKRRLNWIKHNINILPNLE